MPETHRQRQWYAGELYHVSALIDVAREVKTEKVDPKSIYRHFNLMGEHGDLSDFVEEMKRVLNADLKHPILIYRGFVMDGKHRLAKALYLEKKTIDVRYLEELPSPIEE